MSRAALESALPAAALAALDDAGIREYVEGLLDDAEEESDEDVAASLAPFLIDTGAAEDDDTAMALCAAVVKQLRVGSGASASPSASSSEPKLLSAKIDMFALTEADEKQAIAEVAKEIGPVTVNYNSTMGAPVNSLMDEDYSEEAMKKRFKQARRGEKRLKRDARREKVVGMQRDEFMRELTRDPVVLHWRGGGGGSNDILLKGVSMDVNGLVLLEDTDVTLVSGRKYGLTGRNGIGKTTFLKFLAAHRFEGVPPHLQILHIEQEVPSGQLSVIETVLATDIERAALLEEERALLDEAEAEPPTPPLAPTTATAEPAAAAAEATAGATAGAAVAAPAPAPAPPVKDKEELEDEAERQARLNEVLCRLEEIDAATAPARAAAILSGLGFSHDMQAQPTASFSGGWRMRVALARALFIAPDILLLDEPTNHLDLHAVLWLETYLAGWQKTLVVVSHARSFLNNVVTDVLHLQNKGLTRYKGDYDNFEATKAEALRNNERQREAQERTRQHMQSFVDRFRGNAKRAGMVQSRIKAIGRMESLAQILEDPELKFSFPDPETLSSPVLQLVDVAFHYPEKPPLFTKVNLGLDLSSRVALVGPNGIGKSTLLKVVLGDLEQTQGSVSRAPRLRMGRFSQHHVDQLDLNLTALESFVKQYPNAKPLDIRAHLGGMGLSGNTALQKMATLSGGQKSRVAFAQIMWQKPHLLLLDEPTNHLDLDAVEALIHAILNFEGGVLVISHDEHLVSSICEELWVAQPGSVSIFRGEFAEYRRQQLKQTKKGMLPPKPLPTIAAAQEAEAAAAAPPKPKGKIEILPGGRSKRAEPAAVALD